MCVINLCVPNALCFLCLLAGFLWPRGCQPPRWEASASLNKCLRAWSSQVITPLHRRRQNVQILRSIDYCLSISQTLAAPCRELPFTPHRRLGNLIFGNTFWPHPCWDCVLKTHQKLMSTWGNPIGLCFSDRLTTLQLPVFMCEIIDTLKVAMFQCCIWTKTLSYYICRKAAQRRLPHLNLHQGWMIQVVAGFSGSADAQTLESN